MGSLAAKSEVQADADRLSPKPEARTLLGCMWLQSARAIGGDKWSRVCQNGKRWSEIGGGIARRPFRQALLLRNLQGGRAREEKGSGRAAYTDPGGSLRISHRSLTPDWDQGWIVQ
jgi:hypothetical protein